MTPRELIAAFETLAEAPEGVARLRELVLQLAVRGKLVPQDPNDEPATVLLERIRAEKARLVKERKLRVSAAATESVGADSAHCFDAPASWSWCRLGTPAFLLADGSHNPPKNVGPTGVPMLSGTNVRDGFINLDASRFVSEDDLRTERKRYSVEPGDVLVCIVGSIGRAAVVPSEFPTVVLQRSVAIVRVQGLVPEFVAMVVRSPLGQSFLRAQAKGTAQLGVYLGSLANLPLPLPPLAEQHRIVARVDELMGLLDRLEAARDARESTRVALRDAALAALRDADDAEAVQVAWARIAEHMDDLFTHPDDVAPLRQTILQLAVRGRLVPQDPADEPATMLLERIAAEKARLVKEGKIRKSDPLPPVSADEVPFAVPAGWEWCRFDVHCLQMTVGHVGPMASRYRDTGIPFLRSLNVGWFELRPADLCYIDEEFHAELAKSALRGGEILAVRSGNVGRTCVFPADLGPANCSDLVIIRPLDGLVPEFGAAILNSPYGVEHVLGERVGIAQGHFNVGSARMMPTPTPPVAEQRRIVARFQELMILCDGLESGLAKTTGAQAHFASAAVHHLDV